MTDRWPRCLESISSVVLAEFDRAGHLLHDNEGMRRLCADSDERPWHLFTQPHLDDLVQALPDAQGRVHAGLLTASTRSLPMLSLTGELRVDSDALWLVAGYDMAEFHALSSSLLVLNDELGAAYRDLTRSARELKTRE